MLTTLILRTEEALTANANYWYFINRSIEKAAILSKTPLFFLIMNTLGSQNVPENCVFRSCKNQWWLCLKLSSRMHHISFQLFWRVIILIRSFGRISSDQESNTYFYREWTTSNELSRSVVNFLWVPYINRVQLSLMLWLYIRIYSIQYSKLEHIVNQWKQNNTKCIALVTLSVSAWSALIPSTRVNHLCK